MAGVLAFAGRALGGQSGARGIAAALSTRSCLAKATAPSVPLAAVWAGAAAAAVGPARGFATEASTSSAAGAAPWTPTSELSKRKTLEKRMANLVRTLEAEQVAEKQAAVPREVPRPGQMLEVRTSVPENRRRPATFRGVVIAVRNRAIRTTFTLRNHLGPGGVERTFALHSPHVEEIRVLGQREVARAKLYFLRDRLPKEYRVV